MRRAPFFIWTAVTVLWMFDFLLCHRLGLRVSGWQRLVLAGAALAAVALFYKFSGRSARIAQMAQWCLLWLIFSTAGVVLTYLAAARGGSWHDAQFAALDAALGFDWIGWFEFVARHPLIRIPLALAYDSLMLQIIGSVIYFAYRGCEDTNRRLLLNTLVSVLMTSAVFSLLPALGPWIYHLHSIAAYDLYLTDLQGLHDGLLSSFAIPQLKGIVCFPSFHTVQAILLTHAHRRSATFVPVASLNGLMLISLPSEGGHYFVDIVAGAGVAALAILVTHRLERRRAEPLAAAI